VQVDLDRREADQGVIGERGCAREDGGTGGLGAISPKGDAARLGFCNACCITGAQWREYPMISRRAVLAAAAVACAAGPAHAQSTLGAGETRNHPDRDAAVSELRARQWSALTARVAAQSPQGALVLLDDLGNAVDTDANLSGLSEAAGGKTILGALRVGIAWRHRGAGVGETVTEQGFRRFERSLSTAQQALQEAAQADPNDGLAYAYLFRVHKGLGDRRRLDQILPNFLAAARKPVGGLSMYADAVSAKWLGDDKQALAFARAHADSAPPASHGLIPDVHFTCAVARAMSGDAEAEQYFLSPDVRAEVVAAHENFAAAAPESDTLTAQYAHSAFSLAFLQIRDAQRLRYHLSGLGAYRGGPWALLEGADQMILQLRRSLGLSDT
jgi:hypothetical protein